MARRALEVLTGWWRPLVYLGHNALTLTGAVLTTSSGLTLVGFWLYEVAGSGSVHPYTGIILFLCLPALFVLGLLLMPLGVWLRRRSLKRKGELPAVYPRVDLGHPALQRGAALVGVATFLNVVILGVASYRGVEYMDSTQFCGLTCHTVMEPEYAAFVGSPHSRVGCVECHIGPGANWFVRSKLSGARQVWAVAAGTYSRPIPSPVHELRPARETCEQCHWPRKFHGDKLVVKTKYSDDEANTPLVTVLMLRIGGHSGYGAAGIHGRHLDAEERITYLSTPDRGTIPRVLYREDSGRTVEYVSADAAAAAQAPLERRAMDCMDCHNRPTHAFELPERAVDKAITEGRISRSLPYVRRETVRLLKQYAAPASEAAAGEGAVNAALAGIAADLDGFYRREHPEAHREKQADVKRAVEAAQAIFQRNVFPRMNVTWGTYPNNIGHEDFPGCFRCHDDQHRTADGRVINQDCEACHAILAMEESDPKILTDLGLR